MSAIRSFSVRVSQVVRLSPSYQRITFTGPDLADFGTGGPLGTRDLRVKLMLPAPGTELPDLSNLTNGWYQRWLALPARRRGAMRTYTVRRITGSGPDRRLEIDFVLHVDQHGGGGPATTWANAAQVGDQVTLLGPSADSEGYGGITWRPPKPVDGRPVRLLLAGDETAVPAVGAVLESLPRGYRGHAVLEVPYPDDFCQLPSAADLKVTWLARGSRPHGEQLVESVAGVLAQAARPGARCRVEPQDDGPEDLLWDVPDPDAEAAEDWYAWVAGETALVRSLRQLVRSTVPERGRTAFMGYWRHGTPEGP